CKEVLGLTLQDGAMRIFINTFGKNPESFSREFLDFMEYINDTRETVAARSESPRLKLIHSKVEKIRRSEKCGVKYMQRWEEIVYARQDGYEEGRSEGHNEGIGNRDSWLDRQIFLNKKVICVKVVSNISKRYCQARKNPEPKPFLKSGVLKGED
ncbi:MAG: hypothetical protein K2O34_07515, partial [Acetatifactor sp.]|nr:hypothetical protein [Acetatifactor sp.]